MNDILEQNVDSIRQSRYQFRKHFSVAESPLFFIFLFFFLIKYLAGKFHPALQSRVGTLLPHVGALHANSKSQGNSHAVCSPSSLWAQLRYSPESNSLLQYFLQIMKGSAGWDPDNNSIAGQEDIINEDSHWPRSHMHLWQHIC